MTTFFVVEEEGKTNRRPLEAVDCAKVILGEVG